MKPPLIENGRKVLDAVDMLLSKPEGWTQGTYARNKHGIVASIDADNATCFCIAGAVRRVTSDCSGMGRAFYALDLLANKKGFECMSKFNDAPGRSHAEVMQFIREAKNLVRPVK